MGAQSDLEPEVIQARHDDAFLAELLKGIVSKKDDIRFHCHKVLSCLSEREPKRLYSYWDTFVDMLDSTNHYHRYIALHLLANIVVVDTKNRFEKVYVLYFNNIAGDRTMVAGHTTLNAGKIAKAKPLLQQKITTMLLDIDSLYKGKQMDLMKAYVIQAFDYYFDVAKDKKKIIDFVRAQVNSKSPKTRKVAKDFLSKWNQ